MKFTNFSDGTGETAVTKVDATSSTFANQGVVPGIHLKVARIIFAVYNGEVRVQWVASSSTDMVVLSGFGTFDYTFAPLFNPNNAGATGSISFTTSGFTSGSSYTIDLEMLKGV
jgi:hypothetical protein